MTPRPRLATLAAALLIVLVAGVSACGDNPTSPGGGGPALELPDPQISPEKRALLARVYEILDSMGVERRLAWTLRYVEGEKLEVVAERCGCSLATVKRRIASAQALLLAEMEDG